MISQQGRQKEFGGNVPRFPEHEWDAVVSSRINNNSSCPHCSGASTSQPEIRILCELRHLLGDEDVVWREKIDGIEADIFLPNHNLVIEYDGNYWHKNKFNDDLEKNEFFAKRGIKTIRVRQHPLKATSKDDVIVPRKILSKRDVDELVSRIAPLTGLSLDSYSKEESFLNDALFRRYVSYLPSPPPEYSLKNEYPDVAEQWDYERTVHSNQRTSHLVLTKKFGGNVLKVMITNGKPLSIRELVEIRRVVHSVLIVR